MNYRQREQIRKLVLKAAGKENRNGLFKACTMDDYRDLAETKILKDKPGQQVDLVEAMDLARAMADKGFGKLPPESYISSGKWALRFTGLFSPEEMAAFFPKTTSRRPLDVKVFDNLFEIPQTAVYKKTNVILDLEEIKVRLYFCKEENRIIHIDESLVPLIDAVDPSGTIRTKSESTGEQFVFGDAEESIEGVVMPVGTQYQPEAFISENF